MGKRAHVLRGAVAAQTRALMSCPGGACRGGGGGRSVSVSQEVDSTGSTQAAELALEGVAKQLADLGAPRPGGATFGGNRRAAQHLALLHTPCALHGDGTAGSKAVRPTLVTIVLVPSAAGAPQAAAGRGKRSAGPSLLPSLDPGTGGKRSREA